MRKKEEEPITPPPSSRTHDRDKRAIYWLKKPKEKYSFPPPNYTFEQRRHREVWDD